MPKDGIKEVYDFVEILKKKKIPIDQAEKELKKYYQLKGYDRGITLYCNLDSEYRIWGKINLSWPNAKDGPRYDVLHPITKNPVAVPDNGWRYTKTTFDDYLDYEKIVHRADNSYVCGRIWFGNNEKTQPSFIQYLDNVTDFLLRSVISLKSSGGKEFNDLMPKVNFSHPKTYKLISRLLSTIDGKDYTILDFFAGSGTTGHAVAEMNKLDNGNRKFILVQIPEKVDEKHSAFKEGYKKISDITIERNKRVIEKIIEEKKSAKPDLFTGEQKEEALTGLGFKVFKLVKSNFPRVEFAPDPEKSDGENLNLLKKYITEKEAQLVNAFNRDELITEILLKNGFNLNYRIEKWEQFKKNDIYLATDGEKETLMCLDYVLDPETVNYFKSHKETKFICLERALDTTKKYSLKQYLGNMFNAF
jgi:adenine-specific DNA-methyltransferase